jgi:hypothetical protein
MSIAGPDLSQRSGRRASLAIVGTVLFVIGVALMIAVQFIGTGGNMLFYWAYNGFAGHIPQLILFFVGVAILLAGAGLWIAAATSPNSGQLAARAAGDRARNVAAQAEQMKQWEEAYALAHDGQRPPAGVTAPPAAIMHTAMTGTNIMAVLALVFGLLGSVLGIVFGHIALSQMRRTGQSGHGLALAGLLIGYIELAFWLVLFIVFVVLASAHG